MKHISLFSGIGGFDLASEWMGWQNVASCEINPFGRKVLEYYWPNAYHHHDIKTLTYEKLNQELTTRFGADWHSDDIILTGGFPCQPYSAAGKRLGKEDERHLWPEMLRVIREVKPTWIVGENVLGLVNWSDGLVFNEVQADLENEGYEVQPFVLPACAVNAPHRRDRVWFVAYSFSSSRRSSRKSRSIESYWSKNHIQQSEWRGKTKLNNRPSSISWTNTDTDRIRCDQCECRDEEQPSERRLDALGDLNASNGDASNTDRQRNRQKHEFCSRRNLSKECIDSSRTTPDTDNKRLERPTSQRIQTNERGRMRVQNAIFTWMGHSTNWENFPTQSPVCTGDDGISERLDGITFSKWRNESIKAAGNAIVPQVVYQIFKAIEEYEQNRNHGQDREAAD